MASIRKLSDGRWQAQFRPVPGGRQVTRTARRKVDCQRWLDEQTTSLVTGQYVVPKNSRVTVAEWCATWTIGYATRRPSTVRQAQTHIAVIVDTFGAMPLNAVRPSLVRAWTAKVRAWTAKLKAAGLSDSYIYALHSRLSQILSDAVHDGLWARPMQSADLTRRGLPAALLRLH